MPGFITGLRGRGSTPPHTVRSLEVHLTCQQPKVHGNNSMCWFLPSRSELVLSGSGAWKYLLLLPLGAANWGMGVKVWVERKEGRQKKDWDYMVTITY